MKKIVILILAIVMIASMCACSNNADPDAIVDNPKYSESAKENSLYAFIGNEIEMNGVVVAANALLVPDGSTTITNAFTNATFYVDRVSGKVFVYIEDGVGSYATGGSIDTGYVYSGDLIVNGVKIPWLVDPADRKN